VIVVTRLPVPPAADPGIPVARAAPVCRRSRDLRAPCSPCLAEYINFHLCVSKLSRHSTFLVVIDIRMHSGNVYELFINFL
jgi:hypothetical protein